MEEVRLAGLDLLGLWVPVPGRPALEHVRDVDVAASEPDPVQQRLEQLPRLPDEGDAVLVLVEAGCLADEHQLGVRIAGAEDDLGPRRRERAAGAGARLLRVGEQRFAHGSESTPEAGRF